MEDKNIIIILVGVIFILMAVLGLMLLNPTDTKEPTKIKIINDNTQYTDGKISIQLTDLNKTAISKEKVQFIITNNKGKVLVNKSVKTNSKGKAKINLDLKKGKYIVKVKYGGNENYKPNIIKQNLTIKEKVSNTPSDWVDSDGNPHYYENGVEYVGTRDGQHMDIDTFNYVKEHGMR